MLASLRSYRGDTGEIQGRYRGDIGEMCSPPCVARPARRAAAPHLSRARREQMAGVMTGVADQPTVTYYTLPLHYPLLAVDPASGGGG